jgi:hypothetical protein
MMIHDVSTPMGKQGGQLTASTFNTASLTDQESKISSLQKYVYHLSQIVSTTTTFKFGYLSRNLQLSLSDFYHSQRFKPQPLNRRPLAVKLQNSTVAQTLPCKLKILGLKIFVPNFSRSDPEAVWAHAR